MKRKVFIKKCGFGALGLVSAGVFLSSCSGLRVVQGTLTSSFLVIPQSAFIREKKEDQPRRYVIAENPELKYPVCVYRNSDTNYVALLMKCTHQGTELQVFGDRLQCPAHGSEFTKTGEVSNGPASAALKTFPVLVENGMLKIDLS